MGGVGKNCMSRVGGGGEPEAAWQKSDPRNGPKIDPRNGPITLLVTQTPN